MDTLTDEKYLFVTDSASKKQIARSYYHRKTHAGKGGRVRLPHDNLTRKELEKMNGEVKSYRLNDPMLWSEFKTMPDDLKINYISLIRQRYGVSDTCIAVNMLRTTQTTFGTEARRLGIGLGKHCKRSSKPDKEAFLAWCNGVSAPVEIEPKGVEPEEIEQETSPAVYFQPVPAKVIPASGSLKFTGNAKDVLSSVADILGGVKARITITWDTELEGLKNG